MNVDYCTHCGYKNAYVGTAPTYCGGCGKQLNSSIAKGSNTTNLRRPQAQLSVEVTEEHDHIPNIRNLEYQVEGMEDNRFKLSDIMKQKPSENKVKRSSVAGNNKLNNEKDVLKESIEICKSARIQPPSEIE